MLSRYESWQEWKFIHMKLRQKRDTEKLVHKNLTRVNIHVANRALCNESYVMCWQVRANIFSTKFHFVCNSYSNSEIMCELIVGYELER